MTGGLAVVAKEEVPKHHLGKVSNVKKTFVNSVISRYP